MIRKANSDDILAVAALYEKAIDYEDTHIKYTSWQKGIYPTADTARLGVKKDSLFVVDTDGKISAAVILDTHQPPEYRSIKWELNLPKSKVLVIHTLCVDPDVSGSGVGTSLVEFIKQYAKERGCLAIRLNTTERNTPAAHMYLKNGFKIASAQKILLNGQIACAKHLFMEFTIKEEP